MNQADEAAREFAAANIAAKPNARLMCDNPTRQVVAECVARMARVHDAVEGVLELAGTADLPPPVQAFIDADADKGCNGCWFSSKRSKNHPECNDKIARWFAARESLIGYGNSINNQEVNP